MFRMQPLLIAAAMFAPALMAGDGYEFEAPVKLSAGGEEIALESPGYAAPCLADLDGDGVADLLVGQFRDGKISFFKGSKSDDGELTFGEHQWLQAGDGPAQVPGVW